MQNEHRRELLGIMAKVEQLIAEAEAYSVDAAALDDQALLDATRQLGELRRVLTDVERKLNDPNRIEN